MRIVILQDAIRVGGTERQSLAMAAGLLREGNDVTLLTHRPCKKQFADLDHQWLQPFDSGIDEWAPNLEKRLGRLFPDVILCMGSVANAQIKRLKKHFPKVVATARSGKTITRELLENYRSANLVLTNTFALQGALYALGGITRVEVLGNALLVNPRVDSAARLLLRRKMGAGAATAVVLCLQRFIPGKAQHYLMELFACAAEKADAQLWLVGHGPMQWPLGAYARIIGGDKIRVLKQEFPVGYYYSAADIAATASREDALPNFLIEAQAFGLPAVCENYAGCPEIVVNGMTGFVAPAGNEMIFSSSLAELIYNPATRAQLGQNGKALSFRFDPLRQIKLLNELLQRV